MTYDIIVIGKGLMGAAAARHLAGRCAGVALIGPDEPSDRYGHDGVFASHYDEGRITRILDPDPVWARLAQRSIARYREIEQQGGIGFYQEVGHLSVGSNGAEAGGFIGKVQSTAAALAIPHEIYDDTDLAARFPCLRFEPGCIGVYQARDGGYVSPRGQVKAQAEAARRRGATLIAETVVDVRETGGVVDVVTASGRVHRARRALIAAGGFSNTHALLPRALDLAVYARTVALLEIDKAQAENLHGLPSVIYEPHDKTRHCYILPPILYPDGRYYLKIGGELPDPTLETFEQLKSWFQSRGNAADADYLAGLLRDIMPDVPMLALRSDSCVTSYTPRGYPFIDKLPGGRIGVLTGGNGAAAKSADEIGRIGADMMLHREWRCDLGPDIFRLEFRA